MANRCAPLINVVRPNKPKGLKGLDHKVSDQVETVPLLSPADVEPPADRRRLTHPVVLGRNVVSPYLSHKGKPTARAADGGAGKGRRKKRRPSCSRVDRG
jgi:hypothetical protein